MKRILALFLSMTLVLGLAACGNSDTGTSTPPASPSASTGLFTPGTYEGTADGHNGPLTLKVTVDDNAITKIEIAEHIETPGISDVAFDRIPAAIVEQQSLAIDTVATATYTSNAILTAVKSALENSGADISTLLNKVSGGNDVGKEIEKTADVVVIGGGGAGLAAAASATQAGASVILLEKMPALGGNTAISGGGYNAVDPKRQEPMGIEDSVEKHIEQTLSGGDNKGTPALVHTLCENAYSGLEWLESFGMEFKDEVTMITGGLFERGHSAVEALGTAYINVLSDAATAKGAEILLEAKAEEILMDGNRAVGIKASCANGDTLTVHANKAVVVATGGFAANAEYRQSVNTLWPDLGANIPTTNSPSITGDGLMMAEAVGASLINLEDIQLLPLGDPKNGSLGGKIGKQPSDFIFINKEGNRFVAEDERRDVMSRALLEQTDAWLYIVDDGDTYPSADTNTNFDVTIGDLVKQGTVYMDDTVEGLAAQIGVDANALQATIDTYNASVDAGADNDFGKKSLVNKIDKAPFYACPRVPTVHHTMGGIEIDTDAHVLSTNGNIIDGLYAAGEVTGGIHGANRLGGNAIADAIVFGRIAGSNAAAE